MIFDMLTGQPGIEAVDGLGLMIGVKTKKDAGAVIQKCMENGVLVIKAKDKVRLLPALNIPDDLLKEALIVLKNAAGEEET